MNGSEEVGEASVCGAWLAVSLALPEDPWMGEEISRSPTISKQIFHAALGLETAGENCVIQFFIPQIFVA